MRNRGHLIIAAGLVVLGAFCFQLGRAQANRRLHNVRDSVVDKRDRDADRQSRSHFSANHAHEIEHIGIRSFADAYPIIRASSPRQRETWAKELEQMPDGPQKWSAVDIFYKSLVQTDPAQAVALAMNLQSELERIRVAGFMAVVTPYRAMDELIKLMQTFPRSDLAGFGSDAFNDTLESWSAVDPVAVSKFIDAHSQENVPAHRVTLVRYWAAYDPAAAQAWMERTGAPVSSERSERSGVTKALVEGWFENDKAAAIDFVVTNQDTDDFRFAIGSVMESLLRESPDDARAFMDRLKPGVKDAALLDSTDAADFGPEADERRGTRHSTSELQRAPKRQPEFLADWLVKIPPEQGAPVATILSGWNFEQPDRFVNWVAQLPAETRARILSECPTGSDEKLEKQVAAVLALPDPVVRDEILEAMVPRLGSDQVPVIIENPQLSPAQRAHLASLAQKEDEQKADDYSETE